MKIAVMQPYFLPYIGYWQMMNAVDQYVVYDDVTYIKRGWINRNRILLNGQPKYINIPIKNASQNKLISQTEVVHDSKQISKTLRTLEYAYKKAPFFETVFPLAECILRCREVNLVQYLLNSFDVIRGYLNINTKILLSSEIAKGSSIRGSEKILAICEALGATVYCNAIGGRELYSKQWFEQQGVELVFLQTDEIEYKQFDDQFQPSLSIIDTMMFVAPKSIEKFLDMYTAV